MDIQHFLTMIQHINWHKVIHNYHARHYLWEVSKILIPATLTALITFWAMRITDSRNKRRWLNDGHIKRKTELEIGIRKFLLGIKANVLEEYYTLADGENEETAPEVVEAFNKDFDILAKLLKTEEQKKGTDVYEDKSLSALMNEYVCYVPKLQPLFDDFKSMSASIITLDEEKTADLKDKANIYLCFQDISAKILKKLMAAKIK